MDKQNSIIPYAIIASLAKIENIFEMRLFGWVVAKAQSALKLARPELGEINLQFALNLIRVTLPARYLLQPGDRNYKNITKAFELARKTIDYEKNGTHYELNIIAFPELKKHGAALEISFVIHNELWHALLDNFRKGYRLVNLPSFLQLKSTYAAIIYLLISQQSTPVQMSLKRFKQMVGATSKAYERTYNLAARIIEPSKREIDKYCPTTFEYEMERGGRGNGYQSIRFIPRPNIQAEEPSAPMSEMVAKLRSRLDERVSDYLSYKFELTAREIERAEPYLLQLGDVERQMDKLAYVAECAIRARARSRKAYLFTALKG